MPRKKAATAAPVAQEPAPEPPAPPATAEPAPPTRRSGRKKAAPAAPLLDLADRVEVQPTGTAAAEPDLAAALAESTVLAPPMVAVAEPMVAASESGPVAETAIATAAPTPAGPIPEPAASPVPAVSPEPSGELQQAAPAQQESMADRAARYRQRFLADDKPMARRPPPPPIAPPPRQRTDTDAEPAQGPRRALSMAEIAERQRAARSAARESEMRPTAAPPRPVAESMQDRALRFRPATPDEAPAKPAAPTPIAQRPQRVADGLDRAAHATHHRPTDSTSAAPTVALEAPAARAAGVALVLVTRNHASVIAARVGAWRQAVPDVDVRLTVLDLGSTDDTVAEVEEDSSVTVAICSGGLADPLRALAVAVRAVQADVAVLVEAGHPPGPRGVALVQAARAGKAPAWMVAAEEGVVAVPAGALRRLPTPPSTLAQWAGEAGVPAPPRLDRPADWRHGLVVALLGRPVRRRDRLVALLPAPLRPVASKVAGLLAGP